MFELDADQTDLDILNTARNRVVYGKSKNKLVEWTMSEEWTKPIPALKREDGSNTYHRGVRNGLTHGNLFIGEINAK